LRIESLKFWRFFDVKRSRYYLERDMIRHEITIYTCIADHYLKTVNRDLDLHREGDLPAWRGWCWNGTLGYEEYYLNGDIHREGGLPAYRWWCWDGILREVRYIG
jgi:hypothetical protein